MARVRRCLAAYGQVRDNLAQHAPGFPTEAHLQSVLKRGKTYVPFALDRDTVPDVSQIVGPGMETEGSQCDRRGGRPARPTPGGRQRLGRHRRPGPGAVDRARERSPEERAAFVSKIRVHAIGDQDDTGPWIRHHFPELFYILDHSRDGNKMNSCYRGMFLGGDESLTSRAWIDDHVRHDHGPLGALYPPQTWTGPNPHGALKEGDTPSWFYYYLNGLNVPSQPSYGGWGGRYAPNGTFYQDAQDTVDEETSGRATVWRWRPAFQNEFQARMDWCVSRYAEANHKPVAVVNGDRSRKLLHISCAPGETIELDASESSDPDGHALSLCWWIYPEAGTYTGEVTIPDNRRASSLAGYSPSRCRNDDPHHLKSHRRWLAAADQLSARHHTGFLILLPGTCTSPITLQESANALPNSKPEQTSVRQLAQNQEPLAPL